jgi:hypothetical protein
LFQQFSIVADVMAPPATMRASQSAPLPLAIEIVRRLVEQHEIRLREQKLPVAAAPEREVRRQSGSVSRPTRASAEPVRVSNVQSASASSSIVAWPR